MTDKSTILPVLALAVLILASAAEAKEEPLRVSSAVYDILIGENRFDALCLITLEPNTSKDGILLSSDYDIELFSEGLQLEQYEDGMRITGLDAKGEPAKRIILRIRGRIYNHTLGVPLIRFPYRVDNTLIAISAPEKKFEWRPTNSTHRLVNENPEDVLAGDGFREEDLPMTNSEYLFLRSATTKSLIIPKYRLYLGSLEAGEEPGVSCWTGTVYDYYAWETILAILASIAALVTVYLYTRRHMNAGTEPQKEPSAGKRKEYWEKNLKHLEGDGYTVYQSILDEGGEMLQKRICETTGFTSVKVTRILNSLEQKGLIERRSFGVTNKVVLK